MFKVLLDSGAFSAFTSGIQIDLRSYIDFCLHYEKELDGYFNLDVIASPEANHSVLERCCVQGWKNLQEMVRAGLKPIPVFHYPESVGWLDRYLDLGLPRIALGYKSKIQRLPYWMDECFRHIARSGTVPDVHLLGISNFKILGEYPLSSSDGSTYIQAASGGGILCPRLDSRGEFDYQQPTRTLPLSDSGNSLSPQIQNYLKKYFLDLNLPLKCLDGGWLGRSVVNISYFRRCVETYKSVWNPRGTLFCNTQVSGVSSQKFVYYLVVGLQPGYIWKKVGFLYPNWLVSFATPQIAGKVLQEIRSLQQEREVQDVFNASPLGIGRYIEKSVPSLP